MLHQHGSSNPLAISTNCDRIPFHPYYSFKDLFGFFVFFLILSIFLFYAPNFLGRLAVSDSNVSYNYNAICWNSLSYLNTRDISIWAIALISFSVKNSKSIKNQSAGNPTKSGGSSETIRITSTNPHETKTSSEVLKSFDNSLNFSYWLAGLIDGDGSLCVYNNKACSCEITLGKEDIKTLHKIKYILKCGSILQRIKTTAVRWRVYKKSSLIPIIELINGKLLTLSKHQQLVKIGQELSIQPILNFNCSTHNSWFSGFFDAEGYLSIRNDYTLTLSVSQKDESTLKKIQEAFGVGQIYYDSYWNGYNYVVCSRSELKIIFDYFDKFPLQTTKHIDFITFKRLLLFIERGYHLKTASPQLKTRLDNLIRQFFRRKTRKKI